MVVNPKPKKLTPAPTAMDERERSRLADAFIENGTSKAADIKSSKRDPMKPIPVRFDADMRNRIETIADRRGQSAAAWIRLVVSQALEVEEDR